MFVEEELEPLKVNTEPVRLRIVSEPYVIFSPYGYQAAIDVWQIKKRRKKRLFLSARTLAVQLEAIRKENEMKNFSGIEFWINKESNSRKSPYVLVE